MKIQYKKSFNAIQYKNKEQLKKFLKDNKVEVLKIKKEKGFEPESYTIYYRSGVGTLFELYVEPGLIVWINEWGELNSAASRYFNENFKVVNG